MIGNGLVNSACNYAERSENLREKYWARSKEYLQGRLDQHDESSLANIPFIGSFLESQKIRIMRSVLEEKIK